jgi:hypothetical protein
VSAVLILVKPMSTEIILQLSAVKWSDPLRGDYVDGCVQRLYDAINECFELYVPKYIVKDSTVKYRWFDRELHNVDDNRTKALKYLREFETLHVHPSRTSACTTRLSAVFRNLGATLRVFTD